MFSTCEIFSSPGSQRGSGLLILVSIAFSANNLLFNEIYAGYAAAVTYQSNSILYTVVNMYLPHNQSKSLDILSATKQFLQNTNTGHIIIGGDFNYVLDPVLDRTSGIETHTAMAAALADLISVLSLSDPFRVNSPTLLS